MKKVLIVLIILALACLLVGCKGYHITIVNPYSPYYFNARSLDLDYRINYFVKKSLQDSVSRDTTKRMYFTPWVPYGYEYPY